MDNEQLSEQFGELYEKYYEFEQKQLMRSGMRGALEAKRFAKSHRLLIPYLHACFSITNFAQALFEPEVGADNALEIIAMVESEEKARKFQHDFDEDYYQYTVHWISACAYDNLAKHTAMRNGYNSPLVLGAVDDGIHVCRRTGKLECVDCFQEYAVNICLASGDYEMGEHYAGLCATSQNRNDSKDRRFVGYKDLISLSIRRGHFSACFELHEAAFAAAAMYGDPIGAAIDLAQQAELLCLLSGRENELPEILTALGYDGSMPELPSKEENPSIFLYQTINQAVRATCRKDFAAAENLLGAEERFLLGQENLDNWFGIRVQRIANVYLAKESGVELGGDIDSLSEELLRRANKACQWSAIAALEAMQQNRVRFNPLGIFYPIDIGPFATEGTSISVSPLKLTLPLIEKPVEQSEQKTETTEKTAFEQEAETWMDSLKPLWFALEKHGYEQSQAQENETPTEFPQTEELDKLEREIFAKIMQITPETQTGANGETITEPEYIAAIAPLYEMRLLTNVELMKQCWGWRKMMQKNYPDRGRILSSHAYLGFIFRGYVEKNELDSTGLDLPSDEELEQWIAKAFELEPNRTGIATVAGIIFRAHGNNREAQRYFSRATQIDRRNDYATVSLAELYEEADRPKDAMATVELYIRAGGRHPGLLWQGMQIAFRNEMPQDFLLYYDAYTEAQPSYPAIDAQRVWALCKADRFSEVSTILDTFNEQGIQGKDDMFIRALCMAKQDNDLWIRMLKNALKTETPSSDYFIGTVYDPCGDFWEYVRKLPEDDPLRCEFVQFMFERGNVPDNYFEIDDDAENDDENDEHPLLGYYRCVIRQPLKPEIAAYYGWIQITDADYMAIWAVLAADESEAGRLVLEAQARCYPIPAELLECEQLDSYYAKTAMVVIQGRRFMSAAEGE